MIDVTQHYLLCFLPSNATGPGAVCLLIKPSFVEEYLSNTTTPILTSSRSLVLLDDNFAYPQRAIVPSGTDTCGSILHNVRITVESSDIYNTCCNGRMCDQQSLLKNGSMANRCSCMQMNSSGKVAINWGFKVDDANGGSFRAKYMSKQFTIDYVMTDELPNSVNAAKFDDSTVDDRLLDAAHDVCEYINANGGFMIVLWCKRGQVLDQGADQPNNGLPHNAARTTVESSNIKHHIVRVFPMEPERLDLDHIQQMKFDVVSGFRV